VLSIALLMLMVLSFSLGVEKGRRIVRFLQPVHQAQVKVVPGHAVTVEPMTPIQPSPKIDSKDFKMNVPPKAVSLPAANTVVLEKSVALIQREVEILKDFYTVQVASFKQEKYAKQEAMNLKQKGYQIFVIPKGQHSIVCVGRFAKKTEAVAMSGKLRRFYKDCVVRDL
jgi:cell division septation protein DedD